ncbi:MAG: HD domain-containing protein [Zoogloeaceae bacterium]|nr:HD domain-containing protein [Zoogloeaceae bacterium]
MDMNALTAPVIQDREALEEFADILDEKAMELAQTLADLRKTPGDQSLIDKIFRAVHTIKGDANVCKVELGVILAHPVESLLARYRSGELVFSELASETILLAIDQLERAVEKLLQHESLEDLRLLPLLQYLEKTAQALPAAVDGLYAELIEKVTGYPPLMVNIPAAAHTEAETAVHATPLSQDIGADLQFFRSLALQLETYSPLFKGRTTRILRLALETNRIAPHPVDAVQLEAAIYLHDLGMMLLPEHTWLKRGHLTAEERLSLRAHPSFGANILKRMPGWQEAAEMIAQHHETLDGSGYPANLAQAQICPGAKIIAIVDAFEAIMLKHSQKGKNISVLRAIAEINACDNQFEPELIAPFNTIIRRTVEKHVA